MFKKLVPGVLVVVAVTLGASGCAASNVQSSKFQSQLQSKAKLTAAQAACVTKATYKQLPQKSINKIYTSDTEAQLPDGVESTFTTILNNCIHK